MIVQVNTETKQTKEVHVPQGVQSEKEWTKKLNEDAHRRSEHLVYKTL